MRSVSHPAEVGSFTGSVTLAVSTIAVMLLAGACEDGPAEPSIADQSGNAVELLVNAQTLQLAAGDTFRLTATALQEDGAPTPASGVRWSTSAAHIAAVNSSGLVTAISSGHVAITASLGELSTATVIDVGASDATGEELPIFISLIPDGIGLGVGEQVSMRAVVTDHAGQALNISVNWASSAPHIAAVNGDGIVTGWRPGTTIISAFARHTSAHANVNVSSEPTPPPEDSIPASIELVPSAFTLEPGDTARVEAVVLSAGGDTLDNTVNWASSNDDIATVSGSGLLHAVAPGSATILATVGSVEQTAPVTVATPAPDTVPASIQLTPDTLMLTAGDTARIAAVVMNLAGVPLEGATVTWTSDRPDVARISTSGLVTAVAAGSATITATSGSITQTAATSVSDPPSSPGWDRVIENATVNGDLVVPDGQKWLIGPGVRIAGNLRTVNGTIGMRPGSSLHFLDANPDEYMGGGMYYEDRFARDIGLWVGGPGASGQLDVQCTPKVGWNRTGSDPTWRADDEYWISPTDIGDYSPRRWYPGDAIPRVDPRVPAAEVMNVTRDCVIEGPGHIHIHSTVPQRIEYVQLRNMGIARRGTTDPLLTGRYALHIHQMADASRGTVIRGVAAIGSRGRVFVPHGSHGVTLIDNVSVNSFGEALWWDSNDDRIVGIADRSDDILVDRLAVSGVHAPVEILGGTSRISAIELVGGDNLEIRNSAASGSYGARQSNGFNWPSKGDNAGPAVWRFESGNIAHNNEGAGLRFWFNNRAPHLVENTVTYRNGFAGLETGAYSNAIRYRNTLSIQDATRSDDGAGVLHHSSTKQSDLQDGRGSFYENVSVYGSGGPALSIGRLRGTPEAPIDRVEWIDCTLEPGPGHPVIAISEKAANPFIALFRRCGITPSDISWPSSIPSELNGSRVIIEHEDGRRWEVSVDGRVVVIGQQ